MPDVTEPKKRRLFVAIDMPAAIKESLGTAIDALKKTGADAAWVKPANIHLTLKFLGATDPERLEDIRRVIRDTAKGAHALTTCLEMFGGFPSFSSPRILWIALADGEKNLTPVVSALDDALAGLGMEKNDKPFKAHITLARVRSPRNLIHLVETTREFQKKMQHPVFTLDNITLFESVLNPAGPVYSIIEQIKLKMENRQ